MRTACYGQYRQAWHRLAWPGDYRNGRAGQDLTGVDKMGKKWNVLAGAGPGPANKGMARPDPDWQELYGVTVRQQRL